MNGRLLTALLLSVALLGACANEQQPSAAATSVPPSSKGSALSSPPNSPLVEEEVLVTNDEVEVTVEVDPEEAEKARQEAANACYAYARARVDNEAQIDRDISAGQGIASVNSSQVMWSRQVNNYWYKTERSYLFERCMNNKGYNDLKELTRF